MARKGMFAFLLAGTMLVSAAVCAEESVYVDLSVLDSLGGAESPRINSQPLFPEVAKSQPRKKIRKSVSKKARSKKTTAPVVKVVVEETKTAEVSKPETPVIAKTEPAETNGLKENQPNSLQTPEAKPVPVVSEPAPIAEPVQMPVVPEPAPESAPMAEPTLPVISEPAPITVPEQALAVSADTVAPAPLVTASTAPASEKISKDIHFNDDETALDETHRAQLDALAASFENVPGKRIGIYSYNYDDGVDSFKKKRQSLNRAMEIRSYLMDKGFRAFSVKVVNTTDDLSKKNMVTVDELN